MGEHSGERTGLCAEPVADGQSVLLDVGAAMGEGNTNVVVLAGQGVAGARPR